MLEIRYKNEENKLNDVGYKIFLDRYAEKDITKESLNYGDTVLFTIPGTTQKEIGKLTTKDGYFDKYWIEALDGSGTHYVDKDDFDKPLEINPEQMMDRMARAQANFESPVGSKAKVFYDDFRWLLDGYKFVPGGRISAMLGTSQQNTLTSMNCFILGSPKDSMEGIIELLGEQAEAMRRGGGVGFNISSLRPRNSIVKQVNGRSSGAVSFSDLYSFMTNLIQQGGSRRGALLIMLNDWHPDIFDFIKAKTDMGKINFANVSVGISDAFMKAVEEDADWNLVFPDTTNPEYTNWDGVLEKYRGPLITHRTVKAREIWDQIIDCAWASGEPGLWFRDRCNYYSNSFYYKQGHLVSTNPCACEGTLVDCPEGQRKVEDIRVGDLILCEDGLARPVKHIEINENLPVWKVKFSNGFEIEVTQSHQFHAKTCDDIRFKPIPLMFLRVGDLVKFIDRNEFKSLAITSISDKPRLANVRDLYEQETDTWLTSGIVQRGCGEIPNPPWSVCNLGHINLSKFYNEHKSATYEKKFFNIDWNAMNRAVRLAVRFLDNVIDVTTYFNPKIEEQQKGERRIGLGTMGLAELLIKCGIRYGSDEAIDFCDHLYDGIKKIAYDASNQLAIEKQPFPYYKSEMHNSHFMKALDNDFNGNPEYKTRAYRNVVLLTQAPTGSGATMVGTSSGIEPFYAWNFWRTSRLGRMQENVKIYQDFLDEWSNSTNDIELPDYFVTAMELEPKEHVMMQAVIQKHVDQSISKTCNLPEDYTREQVAEIYKLLYDSGCKGGTVYRDNSRNYQVLSTEKDTANFADDLAGIKPALSGDLNSKINADASLFKGMLNAKGSQLIIEESLGARIDYDKMKDAIEKIKNNATAPIVELEKYLGPLRDIPQLREGKTISIETPAGTAHVTLNKVKDEPAEIFVGLGKGGSDINNMAEALGRLASAILRLDPRSTMQERVELIVDQLEGISGPRSYGFGPTACSGLPDAVAKALSLVWLENIGDLESETTVLDMKREKAEEVRKLKGDLCPGCGYTSLIRMDGCKKCDCGFSEC